MATLRMREALRDAMAEEMRRDEAVFVMGEDVGVFQGAFKVTEKDWAGYVMARVGGEGWRGNVGVRIVRTEENAFVNVSDPAGTHPGDITSYDTQADKTQAVSRTIQLVSQDKVNAIVGYSLTDSFLAAAPTAQKAGVPTMAVGLSGSGVTEVGNYMFRTLLDYANLFKTGDPQFVKATKGTTAPYLYGSDTVTTSGTMNACWQL